VGPLSLASTIEELLERKSSSSGVEHREYCRRDPSRWLRGTLYPQKVGTNLVDKRRWLGRYSSLADSGQGVCLVFSVWYLGTSQSGPALRTTGFLDFVHSPDTQQFRVLHTIVRTIYYYYNCSSSKVPLNVSIIQCTQTDDGNGFGFILVSRAISWA
jgi:hypothetical protein